MLKASDFVNKNSDYLNMRIMKLVENLDAKSFEKKVADDKDACTFGCSHS